MEYSYNIANSIIKYVEYEDVYFIFDEENGIISFPTNLIAERLSFDNKVKRVEHQINVTKSGCFWKTVIDLYVDIDSRDNILEIIDIINNSLSNNKNGSFDLDYFEGSISYNRNIVCGDRKLSQEEIVSIRESSEIKFLMFGNCFYDVVAGIKTPKKAAADAFAVIKRMIRDTNSNDVEYNSGEQRMGETFFYTKIVGTTFEGRQSLISELKNNGMLKQGQALTLQREVSNPYDKNAIRVIHSNTKQMLGYIGKDLSSNIAFRIDNGGNFIAEVDSVTGGTGYNYGVNIKITEVGG